MPLRYVITSKDMPGQPEFTIEMRNWEPNAPVSDQQFVLSSPPGARRISLGATPRTGR